MANKMNIEILEKDEHTLTFLVEGISIEMTNAIRRIILSEIPVMAIDEVIILRNDSPPQGHWLQIELRGTRTNRYGVGARVTVVADDLTLIDEGHSGRGYQSHYGTRLYFGLGHRERVDRVEVRWMGGGVDVFEGIRANQRVTLVEGRSRPRSNQ